MELQKWAQEACPSGKARFWKEGWRSASNPKKWAGELLSLLRTPEAASFQDLRAVAAAPYVAKKFAEYHTWGLTDGDDSVLESELGRSFHGRAEGLVAALAAVRMETGVGSPEEVANTVAEALKAWSGGEWKGQVSPPASSSSAEEALRSCLDSARDATDGDGPCPWFAEARDWVLYLLACRRAGSGSEPGLPPSEHDPVQARSRITGLRYLGDEDADLIRFQVELVRGGTGAIYADPCRMDLAPRTRSFEEAFALVRRVVSERVAIPGDCDIRWWMDGLGDVTTLEGPSLGPAIAVALYQLLTGQPPCRAYTITAKLTSAEGCLGPLSDPRCVEEKARAVFKDRDGGYLLVHPLDLDDARRGAGRVPGVVPETAVLPVETLEEALTLVNSVMVPLRELLRAQVNCLLQTATSEIGRNLLEWDDLEALHVAPLFAQGLRANPGSETLEAEEGSRAAGYHQSFEDTEETSSYHSGDLSQSRRGPTRPVVTWTEYLEQSDTTLALTDRALPAIRNVRRTVILGNPGYGKTMQLWITVGSACRLALQKLATWANPENLDFAIFLRASALNGIAAESSSSEEVLHYICEQALRQLGWRPNPEEKIYGFLKEAVRTGRCLVAIDTLDEAKEHAVPIVQALEASTHGPLRLDRLCLLLSCRLADYDAAMRLRSIDEADHLEILQFDRKGMEEAVRKWFRTEPNQDSPAWNAITSSPQVYLVLHSPLLLRLACSLIQTALEKAQPTYKKQIIAWKSRADLYKHFILDIPERWSQRRGVTGIKGNQSVSLRLLPVSAKAARTLHKMYRGPGPYSAIHVADAVQIAQAPYSALDSHDLLGYLQDAGVFTGTGCNVFGSPLVFTHRTLGEFLVACDLAREIEPDNPVFNDPGSSLAPLVGTGTSDQIDALLEKLCDSRAGVAAWQEILVFLAGLLSDPIPLLKNLADKDRDSVFSRRLCLAALCLSEVQPSRRGRADGMSRDQEYELQKLADEITQRVVDLWREQRRRWAPECLLQFRRALPALAHGMGHYENRRLADWLVYQVGEIQSWEGSGEKGELEELAAALGQAGGPEVIGTLLKIIQGEHSNGDKCGAVRLMGALGPLAITDDALEVFRNLLTRQGDLHLRRAILNTLGLLGRRAIEYPGMREVLRICLRDDRLAEDAIYTHGMIGHPAGGADVITELQRSLRLAPNGTSDVRPIQRAAAKTLVRLGPAILNIQVRDTLLDIQVRDTLLDHLEESAAARGSHRGENLRNLGAAFGPGPADEELAKLRKGSRHIFHHAAQALGAMHRVAPHLEIAGRVEAKIRGQQREVPRHLIELMLALGPSAFSDATLLALTNQLEKSPSPEARWQAALVLALLKAPQAEMLGERLIYWMEHAGQDVRRVAVAVAGALGANLEDLSLLDALDKLMADNPEPELQYAIACAVGHFGMRAARHVIAPKLCRLLEADADPGLQRWAAVSVVEISMMPRDNLWTATRVLLRAGLENKGQRDERRFWSRALDAMEKFGPDCIDPECLPDIWEVIRSQQPKAASRALAFARVLGRDHVDHSVLLSALQGPYTMEASRVLWRLA